MTRTAELLKQDLAAINMTQQEFADRLTEICEMPVTQPAISLWCARDSIPPRRRLAIAKILGPDSALVRSFADTTSREWTAFAGKLREMQPTYSRKQHIETQTEKESARYSMRERSDEPLHSRIEAEFHALGVHPTRRLDIGPYHRNFDFASHRSAVSFVEASEHARQPYHPFLLSRRILNLALASKMHPELVASLILVGNTDSDQIAEIRFECDAFGIELIAFDDLHSAVQYVFDRDFGEMIPAADLDDSYS